MEGGRISAFTPRQKPVRTADKALRRSYLRRISRLFRPYWRQLAVVAFLIVLTSAAGVVPAFLLRAVIDTFGAAVKSHRFDITRLSLLIGGMIAIAIGTGAINVVQSYISTDVGQRVMHDLRVAVFNHLQRLSLAFFTRTRTGDVQSRIGNDIGGVDNVLTSTATSVMSTVTTVLATVAAMFLLDWELALLSLALMPIFVLMARRVGGQRRAITMVQQQSMAEVWSMVQEGLSVSGILLGKTMGQEGPLGDRFQRESERLAGLQVRSQMAGRWMLASIQIIFSVMPAGVYWFGGFEVVHHMAPLSIFATLIAFTTLQTRLLSPIGSLFNIGVQVQSSLALFDRIFEYLDLPVEIVEGSRSLGVVRGEVRFEGVWFRYGEGAGWALEGVDVVVLAGTTTAVVGETGAGKTSLGYLVSRLYDPSRGRVLIDGVDVRELSFASLSDAVVVVSQETYLFHASVRENLRFAKPDASDGEIERAAVAAQIHGLIVSLPEGYDTVVGERGYRFSGGEKQRIAIARAVLRDPPILVLDEATSALDTQTERAVQEALARLVVGRTTIAIAHRLSTVRDADQIVVLDHGQVAEIGTYDQLAAAGGRFTQLVTRQRRPEAADASAS